MYRSSISYEGGTREQPDYIYYNADIIDNATTEAAVLNGNTSAEAALVQQDPAIRFNETRESALVRDATEYHFSIVRFTMNGPNKDLPLFIPVIEEGTGQTNPNLTTYSVAISYEQTWHTNAGAVPFTIAPPSRFIEYSSETKNATLAPTPRTMAAPTFVGQWNVGTTYQIGQIVSSTAADNTYLIPTYNGPFYQVATQPAWSSTVSYSAGNVVTYNGQLWTAVSPTVGLPPNLSGGGWTQGISGGSAPANSTLWTLTDDLQGDSQDLSTRYYWVYTYEHWLKLVNSTLGLAMLDTYNAFQAAWNANASITTPFPFTSFAQFIGSGGIANTPQIQYNPSTNRFSIYGDQRAFGTRVSPPPVDTGYIGATNAIVDTSNPAYTLYTFKQSGTLTISKSITADVLLVGGGGGGGSQIGGGGGGGGVVQQTGVTIPIVGGNDTIYNITVGAGGAGGVGGVAGSGTNGGNSSFTSLYTAAGGAGGGGYLTNGLNTTLGGGGGGGSGATGGSGTFSGGNGAGAFPYRGGGGGGGMGGAGTNASSTVSTGGNGGVGILSTISGVGVWYGGGGGGSGGSDGMGVGGTGGLGGGGNGDNLLGVPSGTAGTPNTGGGGGGGQQAIDGHAGGSGIVIVKVYNTTTTITNGAITTTGSPTIVTTNPQYDVYTFTGSGTFVPSTPVVVDYMLVGGGGGGGSAGTVAGTQYYGAGGGAGGIVYQAGVTLPATSYSVTIGAGGNGGLIASTPAQNGGNSTFAGEIAYGGGYGADSNAGQGGIGGSGGGGLYTSNSGISGQGNSGGAAGTFNTGAGGGGGGAGFSGKTSVSTTTGGNGGDGLQMTITGTPTYYGGGGGGSGSTTGGTGGLGGGATATTVVGNGANGTANTGGGGAAGYSTTIGNRGGNGGSGVLIIRVYKIVQTVPLVAPVVTTTGTVTVNSSNTSFTTYSFTSGSGSITFNDPSTVDVLVVAGGGGGGYEATGGGGAGGVVQLNSLVVASGTYNVTVGAGGAGGSYPTGTLDGTNGANSSFSSYIAYGGGGGGGNVHAGLNGASGGGGGFSADSPPYTQAAGGSATPAGQGNNGGLGGQVYAGGGGGGAFNVGGNGTIASTAGNGGNGIGSSITGTLKYYAGGGGGGSAGSLNGTGGLGGGGAGQNNAGGVGGAGTPNTGGGGGGGGTLNGVSHVGGAGGSGIVIVRVYNVQGATQAGSPREKLWFNQNMFGLFTNFANYYWNVVGSTTQGPFAAAGVAAPLGYTNEILFPNKLYTNLIDYQVAPYTSYVPTAEQQLFWVNEQDYASNDSLWSPVSSIVFTSALIPIRAEQTGPPVVLGNGNTGISAPTSQSAFQPIITDISVDQSSTGPQGYRQFIYYAPTAEYRLADFASSKQDIRNIDIQVFWKNRLNNELYPITMYNLSSVSIKVMFRHKNVIAKSDRHP